MAGGKHSGPFAVGVNYPVGAEHSVYRHWVVLKGFHNVLIALFERLIFAQLPRCEECEREVGKGCHEDGGDDPARGEQCAPPRLGSGLLGTHTRLV